MHQQDFRRKWTSAVDAARDRQWVLGRAGGIPQCGRARLRAVRSRYWSKVAAGMDGGAGSVQVCDSWRMRNRHRGHTPAAEPPPNQRNGAGEQLTTTRKQSSSPCKCVRDATTAASDGASSGGGRWDTGEAEATAARAQTLNASNILGSLCCGRAAQPAAQQGSVMRTMARVARGGVLGMA